MECDFCGKECDGDNSTLQWLKKRGYLSKEGVKFADLYYDYCNRLMDVK